MKLVTVILDSSSQTSSGVRNLETTHFPLYSRLGAKCGAVERRPSRDFREARFSTARIKHRRIPRLLRIADHPGIAAVCRARADPDAVPRRYALLGWASGRRSLKNIAEQWL